jgi:hypothetical protein
MAMPLGVREWIMASAQRWRSAISEFSGQQSAFRFPRARVFVVRHHANFPGLRRGFIWATCRKISSGGSSGPGENTCESEKLVCQVRSIGHRPKAERAGTREEEPVLLPVQVLFVTPHRKRRLSPRRKDAKEGREQDYDLWESLALASIRNRRLGRWGCASGRRALVRSIRPTPVILSRGRLE